MANAKKVHEFSFRMPMLAHAAMEPLNCTVKIDAQQCEVWTGTQFQTIEFGAAIEESGVLKRKR